MKNTQQLADRREALFPRYVPGKRGCRGRKTGFVTLSAFSPCGVFSAGEYGDGGEVVVVANGTARKGVRWLG